MENRENKLIADKINSLDSLPDGYIPNLEAKWALLQSNEKKEKAVFLFGKNTWLKIAACLVILFLSTVLWMNKTTQHQSQVATTIPQSTPLLDHKEKVKLESEPIADNKINHLKLNSPKKKSGMPTPIQPAVTPNEQQLTVVQQTSDTSKATYLQEPLAIEKTKKSRYVQMDFENEVIKPEVKNTFAQGIQFRIGLKNFNIKEQNSDDNPSLKLKHNF